MIGRVDKGVHGNFDKIRDDLWLHGVATASVCNMAGALQVSLLADNSPADKLHKGG